jgi:hypothetical protein
VSPSWGAANCAATQEPTRILWNLKIEYGVHKGPPLVLILSHNNPIHTSLRSILILSTHLRLGLPSGIFPSGFPTNILYAFNLLPHSCYMPRPFHPSWLDYSKPSSLHKNIRWISNELIKPGEKIIRESYIKQKHKYDSWTWMHVKKIYTWKIR